MKKIIIIIVALLLCSQAWAQQDAMLSQYMFNGLFLNPAYAGTHKYTSATLLHRRQWTAFAGAPVTSFVTIDGQILKERVGWGLMLSNDQIGVTGQTDFFANYNYQIPLGKGRLSMGLKLGVSQYTANLSALTVWDKADVVFMGNRSSALLPKAGCGVYYYAEKFYAGVSIPTLWAYDNTRRFSFNIEEATHLRRHYFITGGYVIDVSKTVKIKPSVLIKYQSSAPAQADLNLNALFLEKFWLGVSMRSGDAMVIISEYQINKQLRIGYAFDYTYSRLSSYSGGTHEIMLGYDFGKLIKIKTPRYF
ncbi:MAG: type IX secretion system membrane protein PorP/SprF [Bacteroidia bacterium]|nr:type IX secretion system membrane protein PorP/SprF [Bacteroidia bacterium]